MMSNFTPFIQDRAILERYYDEWRKSKIPVAKCTTQSFITFLIECGLMDDDSIHRYVDDKENG